MMFCFHLRVSLAGPFFTSAAHTVHRHAHTESRRRVARGMVAIN